MVATRRELPDAVVAWRGDWRGAREKEPARGVGLGRGEVGWRGRRAAAGGFAGALGRLRQMKAGAWEQTQAVAAARRASPAHGRPAAVAPWRGRDATRGNGRGAALGRPDVALGWAERGAHGRRALLQAGPASAVGREGRRRPVKGEKHFSIFDFQGNFK